METFHMDAIISNMDYYLQASITMSFIAAFLGGLLASFTPCVYPMIPITAGVIGNRNIGGSKAKGFFLSLIYVSGMATTLVHENLASKEVDYYCCSFFAHQSGYGALQSCCRIALTAVPLRGVFRP